MQPSNASLRGEIPNPEQPDPTGALIWSAVSVAVGISAIVFGVKGRKLAKAEASGRISATAGLVLGDRLRGGPDPRATGVHQHHQP